MGFWEDYDVKMAKKGYVSKYSNVPKKELEKLRPADFWSQSLPSFVSAMNDQTLGNAWRAGAQITNDIATGFNQKEATKRTDEFMASTGMRDKNGLSKLSNISDPNAYQAGAITGAVASLPTNIAEQFVTDPGKVGATFGNIAGIGLGLDKKYNETVDTSIADLMSMKQSLQPTSILAPSLSKEQQKMSDAIDGKIKKLQEEKKNFNDNIMNALDPVKFASASINTVMNVLGTRAITNAVSKTDDVAKLANGGLDVVYKGNALTKAIPGVVGDKLDNVSRAFVAPTSFKSGAASFGSMGALSGGVQSAAEGGSPLDIAGASAMGAGLGATLGGFAGFLGGRNLKLNQPKGMQQIGSATDNAKLVNSFDDFNYSNRTPQTAMGRAAMNQSTLLEKAQATRAASVVDDVAPAQVVNGSGNPFDQPVGNVGDAPQTTVQSTPTDTSIVPQLTPAKSQPPVLTPGASKPQEQIPLADLPKLAKMDNPADGVLNPGEQDALQSLYQETKATPTPQVTKTPTGELKLLDKDRKALVYEGAEKFKQASIDNGTAPGPHQAAEVDDQIDYFQSKGYSYSDSVDLAARVRTKISRELKAESGGFKLDTSKVDEIFGPSTTTKPKRQSKLAAAVDNIIAEKHPELIHNVDETPALAEGGLDTIPKIHVDDLKRYFTDTKDFPATYKRTTGKKNIDELAANAGFDDVDQFIEAVQAKLDSRKLVKENNKALAALRRDPKIKSQAEKVLAKENPKPKSKTMAAEVTPGKTNELVYDISLTDEQVNKAVQALNGKLTKNNAQKLKGLGATDKQLRDAMGIDSNGIQPKPMKVVNEKPPKPADIPPDIHTTAEEFSNIDTAGSNKNVSKSLLDWTDENVPDAKPSLLQKINKAISPGADTLTRMTETLGAFGSHIGKKLLHANMEASNMKTAIRPNLIAIKKLSKQAAGKTQAGKIELGKKLNAALENRALGDKAFDTQVEKDLYNNMVIALDTVKAEMVKRGMQVRENYTPYQMMKDFGEGADYLQGTFTKTKTRVESGHALERRANALGDLNDQNIIDLLPNYANGMIDHIAYSPVKQAWENGIGSVPASLRRNKQDFQDGLVYANKALSDMVNRRSSSILERGIQGLGNAYYRNALYMNPKNAMYSQLQKLQAVADTTHTGRKIANGLSKETKALMRENLSFSGYTISQDAAPGMNEARTQWGKFLQKIDINRIGEESAVNQPYQWGFVDSIIKSDAYKVAKKAGMGEDDAIRAAMKNKEALNQAAASGNVLINDTMFGANSVASPELLRGQGVIKKAFGMFQRFPIAESNYVKKMFTINDTRMLEAMQKGDPRRITIAQNRKIAQLTQQRFEEGLSRLKEKQKSGMSTKGMPSEQQFLDGIEVAKYAVDKADAVIKAGSNISAPKRAAAFSAMWIGSGAVASIWNGVLNYGKEGYKEKGYLENLVQQDPTLASKLSPWVRYSVPSSGLTSPLIPFNAYGLNTQSALNLIPGAGIANRVSGGYMGSQLDKMLKGK
jgi:hypothetical protein